MRKIFILAVLMLTVPMTVFASNSIDYLNRGGLLHGSKSGLTLTDSVLIAVKGLNGITTGKDLGDVSFSTGALIKGSLARGAEFASGGSFTITGDGTGAGKGTLFSGVFSSPVSWTMVTLANGTHKYTLSGKVSGTTGSGFSTAGVLVQLTINTGKGFFTGSRKFSIGDTRVVVPEPGSLGLIGTGMLVLGRGMRRKLRV